MSGSPVTHPPLESGPRRCRGQSLQGRRGCGEARVGEQVADEVCLGSESEFVKDVPEMPSDTAFVATGGEGDIGDVGPLASDDSAR